MTRIPLTIHLTILAGIIVIFNHCASSETGDVALNKVTGAAGRFYALFHDTVTALHHSCTTHLETTLCGPTLSGFLPHDARLRYCHTPIDDSEDGDGTLNRREPDGGFGSSDFAFVYYQPRAQPLDPRTSVKDVFGWTRDWSDEHSLSRAVWNWSGRVAVVIGAFLLRVWASWWWFRAPLKVTGVLLAAYSTVSALDYLGTNVVLRFISQTYVTAVVEFMQCIQWEAERHAWDVGVAVMVQVSGVVSRGYT